jgi:YggT family protein
MLAQIGELLAGIVADFFVFLLLARFHFQWLRVPFRNQVGEFVIATTNWAVQPARRLVPAVAGLDLATLVCAWLVQAAGLGIVIALRGVGFAPATLAALAAVDLLRYSLYILIFAVIVQAALSWVNPYSPFAPVFDPLTRRFLRPFRRLLPPIANVDLAPLLLLVLLQILLIPVAYLRGFVAGMP